MKKIPESIPEKQEYDVENGISEVVRRVQEISEKQRHIVVAVIGSGTDVGKSTVSAQISRALMGAGMHCASDECITDIFQSPNFLGIGNKGNVFILRCEERLMP